MYFLRCADIDLNLDGGLNRQPSVAEADPFLAFSSGDLADMDKEVEDILSGDSDSDSDLGGGGVSDQSQQPSAAISQSLKSNPGTTLFIPFGSSSHISIKLF